MRTIAKGRPGAITRGDVNDGAAFRKAGFRTQRDAKRALQRAEVLLSGDPLLDDRADLGGY